MADKIATRQAYGEALIELVEKNDKVVVLDADLANATQTCKVAKAHPEKFYNFGIAEANMVDAAAGMSTMGLVPFCSTFAMFAAGRAYEQIRNSVAYPHFNVKICATHAGVSVGEDGGSHQCIEDLALMRVIPGMTVICPADANEAKAATTAIADFDGPVYMRLARLATPVFEGDMVKPFVLGKANVLREGKDVAIFATGLMVNESLMAAEALAKDGIDAAVINVHTIKPIDAECVTAWAEKCGKVITVEEHSVIGGLGDAVADVLMGKVNCKFHKIGVNDQFGQSGKAADVLRGRKVHPDVRCIVIPATQQVYKQCIAEGLMDIFLDANCAVSTPTCGPCLGGYMGILAAGERSISTSNRNFVGRMGDPTSEVYLSSPAVAAASAVLGHIGLPEDLD